MGSFVIGDAETEAFFNGSTSTFSTEKLTLPMTTPGSPGLLKKIGSNPNKSETVPLRIYNH